ncbi:MAG TPA: YciI family protein [Bryobacteraceae bacterium]|jgi:hypothetical protein|nr:YciI family protein [Bryobacteraceae bacterium]
MQYAFLIYTNEKENAQHTPEVRAQRVQNNIDIIREAQAKGAFDAILRLQPTSASVTARRSASGVAYSDGPFAETKEALGGFYLIDCKDENDARYWAARLAKTGCSSSVEFRPVQDVMIEELQKSEMAVAS